MPKVSAKQVQRRIVALDAQYTVAQPKRPARLGDIRGAENGTPMLARRDIDATNAGIVEAALQFA
jgi:hypothetical protein